ncbi:MAG: ribose 5-phosphate isomerase B [Myxococcaceae bacterium]
MSKFRKIALASDHAGFELKEILKAFLSDRFEILDLGTDSTKPVDYPDYAKLLADAVVNKQAERGILLCGSGVGASIAANKVAGIRAGLCHDSYSAHQGVEHDHMNVLVLGARIIGEEVAKELVSNFLAAKESQDERHLRRLEKISALEAKV